MSKTKNFSLSRVIAVTWRILTQISRDRRTITLMIFIPAIIMLIFGFVLGGQAKNLPVIVDNQDAGYTVQVGQNSTSFDFGNEVLSSLQLDDRVKLSQGRFDSGKTGVDNGTYYAAITFPANFSEVLARARAREMLERALTRQSRFTSMEPTLRLKPLFWRHCRVLCKTRSAAEGLFSTNNLLLEAFSSQAWT